MLNSNWRATCKCNNLNHPVTNSQINIETDISIYESKESTVCKVVVTLLTDAFKNFFPECIRIKIAEYAGSHSGGCFF